MVNEIGGKCNTLMGCEKYLLKFCYGKRPLEDLIIDGMVILKLLIKEGSLGVWTVLSLLMTGIEEQNNKPSDCLKGEEFHECVSIF